MSNKIKSLVEDLKNLSLIEAHDLLKSLEEFFGPFQIGAAAAPSNDNQQSGGAVEVPHEFDVILVKFPDSVKFALIKEIRNIIPELGLADAKKFVDDTISSKSGKFIKERISKEDAEAIKKKLVNIGIHEDDVKISPVKNS